MKKKRFICFYVMLVAILVFCLFSFFKTEKKEIAYNDLINISDLPEEFMQDYFEGMENLQEEDKDKDNILIVTSTEKIKNTYGATDIVEAPNHQYILQYDSKEKKEEALKKLKTEDSILNAEENIVYKVE